MCPPLGCGHVRRNRARATVRGVRRRARGEHPTVPVSFERLERAARKAMSPEGFAYVAGGAGTEDTLRENARVRALAHRSASPARRLRARHGRRCVRHVHAEPVRAVPDRRARGRTARPMSPSHALEQRRDPVRLLQPGIASDRGDRSGDGRCAALVPALLEHVERPRRESRRTRR